MKAVESVLTQLEGQEHKKSCFTRARKTTSNLSAAQFSQLLPVLVKGELYTIARADETARTDERKTHKLVACGKRECQHYFSTISGFLFSFFFFVCCLLLLLFMSVGFSSYN